MIYYDFQNKREQFNLNLRFTNDVQFKYLPLQNIADGLCSILTKGADL